MPHLTDLKINMFRKGKVKTNFLPSCDWVSDNWASLPASELHLKTKNWNYAVEARYFPPWEYAKFENSICEMTALALISFKKMRFKKSRIPFCLPLYPHTDDQVFQIQVQKRRISFWLTRKAESLGLIRTKLWLLSPVHIPTFFERDKRSRSFSNRVLTFKIGLLLEGFQLSWESTILNLL